MKHSLTIFAYGAVLSMFIVLPNIEDFEGSKAIRVFERTSEVMFPFMFYSNVSAFGLNCLTRGLTSED